MIAVGIARAVDEELRVIASDPEGNVFRATNFEDLARLEHEVSDAVCFAGRMNK